MRSLKDMQLARDNCCKERYKWEAINPWTPMHQLTCDQESKFTYSNPQFYKKGT